jgi:polyprenyldihydroxybenzoate methyltransferase/3-demethylubiquinol 3-O-methyltransferase
MATKRAITMLSLPASVRQALLARSALQQTSPTIVPAHVCKIRSYSTEAQSNSPTSSVNATEVSHFNTLASEWWDPHGSSRLLHLMNPLRHEFINHCLATNPLPANTANKRKYLDIGCGGGIFAESAARLGATRSVTAVDPTPEVINVAKRHQRTDPLLLQPGRLDYQNIPVESLPLAAEPEGERAHPISSRLSAHSPTTLEARRLVYWLHDCAHWHELVYNKVYGGGGVEDGAARHA